ncbi:MAG: hypothetical protein QOE53_1838 [Pseudonocardiales bacterium]|nr:hypothetical protein [Pseudonocardiales bacterium]
MSCEAAITAAHSPGWLLHKRTSPVSFHVVQGPLCGRQIDSVGSDRQRWSRGAEIRTAHSPGAPSGSRGSRRYWLSNYVIDTSGHLDTWLIEG